MSEAEIIAVSVAVTLLIVVLVAISMAMIDDQVRREMHDERMRWLRSKEFDLRAATQTAAYSSLCRIGGHDTEVLDGVDTCIRCGVVRLPDGSWLDNYAVRYD